MSRWWTELLATISDRVPLSLVVVLLFTLAALVGVLWYFFPRWVPRRLPRLRSWRWRRPGWRWPSWRRRRGSAESAPLADPEAGPATGELPDRQVAEFLSLADRLAAEGRYAEAVRERLRAMVRDLLDHGVIEHRPGWTVTELAGAASAARPAVDAPLGEAAGIFSDIWYGLRPATAEHDARMRTLTGEVARAVSGEAGPFLDSPADALSGAGR